MNYPNTVLTDVSQESLVVLKMMCHSNTPFPLSHVPQADSIHGTEESVTVFLFGVSVIL
jgi:hypothetical protein